MKNKIMVVMAILIVVFAGAGIFLQKELQQEREEKGLLETELQQEREEKGLLETEIGRHILRYKSEGPFMIDILNIALKAAKEEISVYGFEEVVKTKVAFWEKRISDPRSDLRNPTLEEVIDFIEKDQTDKLPYVPTGPEAFICSHFAYLLCSQAEEAGIRMGIVPLTLKGSGEGHAVVAVETEKGCIYFEPQTDQQIDITLEKKYENVRVLWWNDQGWQRHFTP